ncbi:MAG: CYTH domain-containing protein [Planctomycetaceae bacterium]
MPREIERKFLVQQGFIPPGQGVLQRQGYLLAEARCSVRVRVEGGCASLCIKGPQTGLTRAEFEYAIPVAEAEELLGTLCPFVIEKTRHRLRHEGHTWEVDIFHGANEGLVTAEVELPSEDAAPALPSWIGQEVSEDPRYRVAYLSRHPFRRWR